MPHVPLPRRSLYPLATLLGTALLALMASAPAHADLIFFKDGFVIEGKVHQEGTTAFEGGQMLSMGKDSFFVDDFARRIFFSRFQVQKTNGIVKKDYLSEGEFISRRDIIFPAAKRQPPMREITSVTPWTSKWDRVITYQTIDSKGDRQVLIDQHLSVLAPYYARVDALSTVRSIYPWAAYYLTRELEPDTIRSLLSTHPELKENKDEAEDTIFAKRLRVFQFFLQAGLNDSAEEELNRLVKEFPGQKKRLEEAKDKFAKVRALQRWDDLKRAQAAGQHRWVRQQLADFPEQALDENFLVKLTALRKEYDQAIDHLHRARRLLSELPCSVSDTTQMPFFLEAARTISEELSLDNFLLSSLQREKEQGLVERLDRLETFLTLAQQAERQRQPGKKPAAGQTAEELLAAAVTGWVLGNKSAETKPEAAVRAWNARQFVLSFQRTYNRTARQTLLTTYQNQRTDALSVDEIAQLTAFLPAPEPDDFLPERVVELRTDVGFGRHKVTYLLQKPPEYHPARSYPVLIVLPDGGERTKIMVDHWGELAARNGYLLAVPEWQVGRGTSYAYTEDEHTVVLDLLRDLRRRFGVDSDRVFLAGNGEGGTMAYDVGLSYPDQFAGVLPFSGHPALYTWTCRYNAQYLPMYVVGGSHTGQRREDNLRQVKEWIPNGYNVLYVEYKGRGLEWFAAEVPIAFDWMNRKKRARPIGELGRNGNGGTLGQEFRTMRPTAKHFYWLSAETVYAGNTNDPARWDNRVFPARLDGRCADNVINVNIYGVKHLAVRLTRDMGIDFDKPLIVNVNLRTRWNKKVTPNLETLMDELYQHGDRQRLVVARVEIKD